MIHNALLKVLACSAAGASLAGLLTACVLQANIDAPFEQISELYSEELAGFTLLGAIVGLVVGIGWVIEHKAARWRFVGWAVGGIFVGLGITSMAGNAWFVLGGTVLGIGVGIVTALESAGKFPGSK